jgi:hypothetical protein
LTLLGIQTSFLSDVAPYWLANGGAAVPLGDPIADLHYQRQQLQQSDLATACLEKAKCHRRECYQWYWRSNRPIFNGKKRCYVGMDGSVAVLAARQAIGRRRALERVDRQLKLLETGNHADAT